MSEVEHILPVQNEVGETPIWIPEEQALYWIDMGTGSVNRYKPADGQTDTFPTGLPITALARRASGGWLLTTKQGLYFWNHETGDSEFIVDPEADNPACRFNDGAVDRQGRFLVGTLNEQELTAPDGVLYRLDPDGSITKLDDGLAVANGIGFSPDGSTVYVTDMFHNRILAYDYDTGAGTVSGKRTFVDVPADNGYPDGLIVDGEGFVWSAHWAGARVTRYDTYGRIVDEYPVPAANVTCMCLGGENLDELYITTAWFMMSEEERQASPLTGDLFKLKTDAAGLVEPGFAG